MLSGALQPTKTYARREFQWLPTADREGVLVIRQRRTAGGREDKDVYLVEEQTRHGSPYREFLVVNATDPDQPDAYQVTLIRGHVVGCTCMADRCKVPVCKHKDAIEMIVACEDI